VSPPPPPPNPPPGKKRENPFGTKPKPAHRLVFLVANQWEGQPQGGISNTGKVILGQKWPTGGGGGGKKTHPKEAKGGFFFVNHTGNCWWGWGGHTVPFGPKTTPPEENNKTPLGGVGPGPRALKKQKLGGGRKNNRWGGGGENKTWGTGNPKKTNQGEPPKKKTKN